jgi:hypothetical protein
MDMSVDKPGQKRFPVALYDFGIRGNCDLIADSRDLAVPDDYRRTGDCLLPIENPDVLDNDGPAGFCDAGIQIDGRAYQKPEKDKPREAAKYAFHRFSP